MTTALINFWMCFMWLLLWGAGSIDQGSAITCAGINGACGVVCLWLEANR
jgi:hypothetical protein